MDSSSPRGGLPGVSVSNGEHVVVTDGRGRYELDLEPGSHAFVWVTVPAGMRPVSEFYRRAGELKGSAGDEVDFQLTPALERGASSFRLAQITDTHVVAKEGRLSQREVLARSLAELEAAGRPDFIIASGDLTNRGQLDELREFRGALAAVGAPVFLLFGGHDGNQERHGSVAGAKSTFTRNYEAVLGPTYYSFDWGEGWHFVIYPNEEYFFSEQDQRRKAAWLEADLASQPPGRQTVMAVHTPPPTAFLEGLAARGVVLVVHGHWHSSKTFSHAGVGVAATPPLCFGGIDTRPRSYRIIDFRSSERGVVTSLRALGADSTTPHRPPERVGSFELDWERPVPGGIHRAGVVVRDGDLLVSLCDEDLDGGPGVLCLSAQDGQEIWRTRTDASIKNRVALNEPSRSRAAALSVCGRLHWLDTTNGTVLWAQDLPGYPHRWLYTSPVSVGDTVYAGGKAGLGAFQADSGQVIWYNSLEDSDNWSCYASPISFDHLLIILVQRRGILALDRTSGEIVWELAVGVEYQYAAPVLVGDLIVSGGDSGELLVLRAATGEVVVRCKTLSASYPSGLTAAGDRLFATTPDGQVRCHDLESLEPRWTFDTGPDLLDMTPYQRGISSVLASAVLVGEERVVVGGNDGVLYILDAGRGACEAQAAFGAPITAPISVVDGGFCVGTLDGRLCRYVAGSPSAADHDRVASAWSRRTLAG
jgi:outer membrane protein assembly factor BamB/predicted MPP superfamily phosphohydrolase